MKLLFPFLMSVLPAASVLAQTQAQPPQPPSDVPSPKTTEVMVILTAKQGVTRQQIMNVMPAEIRATVKLYLDGKIRQWYSRGDGRGVVFIMACNTVEEAKTQMEQLPLAKLNVMDYDYMPLRPLQPLTFLIEAPAAQK